MTVVGAEGGPTTAVVAVAGVRVETAVGMGVGTEEGVAAGKRVGAVRAGMDRTGADTKTRATGAEEGTAMMAGGTETPPSPRLGAAAETEEELGGMAAERGSAGAAAMAAAAAALVSTAVAAAVGRNRANSRRTAGTGAGGLGETAAREKGIAPFRQ